MDTIPHPLEKLLRFRETHPLKQARIQGQTWSYLSCGAGERALLILGGALGTAESPFETIQIYEASFRVLSLTYPTVGTMGALTDGIVELLALEGISDAHVFGGSMGAGAAHVLVRRHPQSVDKLALSSFGLYNTRNLRLARTAMRLFRLAPYNLTAGYYRRRMCALLQEVDPETRAFYLAYTDDLFDHQLDRKSLLGQFQLMADLAENPERYRMYEPVERPGRVLILQAADDTGFAPDEQAALRATYPGAKMHLFESGGHLASLVQREEYEQVRREFLLSQ
jgi:pimeloyl-ACP methyl ester carboxylesterase